MAMTETESVASLKLLVAMAQADGTLQAEEKEAISGALANVKIAGLSSADALFAEKINVDAEIAKLSSDDARNSTYQAVYSLAYADGTCTKEEQALLDTLKTKLKIAEEKSSMLGRIFSEAKDTMLVGTIDAINDPAKRNAEIKEDVLKYSVLSGILGANPLPLVSIATDLAVVGIQTKMFLDIGQYYGHRLDKETAKSFLAGVGLGTGARIAVTNLCKFIPGFGSVVGAAAAFASTYALGKVAQRYYDSGMKMDLGLLKKEFKEAEKEGKSAYEANKKDIDAQAKAKEAKIKDLATQLKDGKITKDEYQKKVADLA